MTLKDFFEYVNVKHRIMIVDEDNYPICSKSIEKVIEDPDINLSSDIFFIEPMAEKWFSVIVDRSVTDPECIHKIKPENE